MKNIIAKAFSVVSLFAGLTSCESYLDKAPESTAFSNEQVFTDYEKSQAYVDQLLIPGYYNENPWQLGTGTGAILNGYPQGMWGTRDRWTDDCMINTAPTVASNGEKYLRTGEFYKCATTGGSGAYSENDYQRFNVKWRGIRVANTAITNISRITNATPEEKGQILGLAYYMRAHFYFELLQGWGGMPWIPRPLSPDANLDLPRDSYKTTAQKIAASFDSASVYLPVVVASEDWRRPSKVAALAYKAKALVWAASPFSNPQGDQQLWKDAAIAAGQAIDAAEKSGYYHLVDISNWRKLFADVNEEAFHEVLYGHFEKDRILDNKTSEDFQYCGIKSTAFGAGNGAESPTENMAQCFSWSNGEPVNPTTDEYKYTPFTGDGIKHIGRDPRFNLTFVYNGQKNPMTDRENRKVEIWNESYNKVSSRDLLVDAQIVPTAGYTVTGYYNWKLFPEPYYQVGNKANLMYNYMRLADIYLYYAEAANRAWGPTAAPQGIPGFSMTAVDALNKIRIRANMPIYDNSKPWLTIGSAAEFEAKIRNEFRVETAFEAKRFYDLRRWKMMTDPSVLIQKGLYIKRTAANTYEYTVVRLMDDYQLKWQEPHYLFPINPTDTFLGPNFVQNPGW